MNIPDDVIDAGARAIHEQVYGPDWWELDTCDRPARRAEARAALSAALPLLALDRDTIAKTLGAHRVERQAFAPSPEFYCHDCDENSPGTPEDHLADAVIAASPLRSVIEVKAEALEEFARHLRATYPEDVFPPLTDAENVGINAALARAATRSRDAISADMMRRAAAQAETRAARIREGGQP